MVHAVVARRRRSSHSAAAQVAGVGGAAHLVGHHRSLVALAAQPQHRVDEVLAAGAEEPDVRTTKWRGLAAAVALSPASFERP